MSATLPAEIEKARESRAERASLQSEVLQADGKNVPVEDAVFGQMTEDGPDYRSVRIPHRLQIVKPSPPFPTYKAPSSFTV